MADPSCFCWCLRDVGRQVRLSHARWPRANDCMLYLTVHTSSSLHHERFTSPPAAATVDKDIDANTWIHTSIMFGPQNRAATPDEETSQTGFTEATLQPFPHKYYPNLEYVSWISQSSNSVQAAPAPPSQSNSRAKPSSAAGAQALLVAAIVPPPTSSLDPAVPAGINPAAPTCCCPLPTSVTAAAAATAVGDEEDGPPLVLTLPAGEVSSPLVAAEPAAQQVVVGSVRA